MIFHSGPAYLLCLLSNNLFKIKLNNLIFQVIFHSGPAYLFDLMALVSRQKPFMVKISQKMHKATKVRYQRVNPDCCNPPNKIIHYLKALEYFTTHEWRWTNDNTLSLGRQITDSDRSVGHCNTDPALLYQFVCCTILVGHFTPKSNDDCLPWLLSPSFFSGSNNEKMEVENLVAHTL